MNVVVLLLGTNLGDKNNNLALALELINIKVGLVISKTKILKTKAVEFDTENSFLNQALKINTLLSPIALLQVIKNIEIEMGREKIINQAMYQDRIIDVDIVHFNSIVFESAILQIPHKKHTENREFSKILLEELNLLG